MRLILTFSCRDRMGIVHEVARFLHGHDCNILDSAQYGDPETVRFFMRVRFEAPSAHALARLETAFAEVAGPFEMDWHMVDEKRPLRTLIFVSKQDHCLRDLLYRTEIGELPIDVRGVVSNHPDHHAIAAAGEIPYHYLPVTRDSRAFQEEALLDLAQKEEADLLVLARYMQVLSPKFCGRFVGRIINIHHSFLPGFKGARPYHQAHARGVKVIGATAHYVTDDLDEGPIIEQEVTRVTHAHSVRDLIAAGRDLERMVLARAVRYHAEQRVLLNGHRTVVLA